MRRYKDARGGACTEKQLTIPVGPKLWTGERAGLKEDSEMRNEE